MINKSLYQKLSWTVVTASYLFFSSNTYAAPGTLPNTPLFLSNSVEPNIFYTLDDSGSMEWETMISDGTASLDASGGVADLEGWNRFYMFPVNTNGRDGWYGGSSEFPGTVPSTDLYTLSWVFRNSTGNKLYYNPEIDYTPWVGTDTTGTPLYAAADPENALIDPNNASYGTFDLTSDVSYKGVTYNPSGWYQWTWDTMYPATYFTWTDDDGDGAIEDSDTHTLIEIKPANAPFPTGRSYDEEIKNFANWFQYYRKRSFVAKAALGDVINNTDATRMGLDIYNGGHQSDATSMTDPAQKELLLNSLYNLGIYCGRAKGSIYPDTCPSTPARFALKRVGDLFSGSRPDPSPILPEGDGGECQQNFGIIMSDGYWNGWGDPAGIGNADKDDDGTQVDGFDGGNYADNFSVTLADVAMHYYEHDLNGSLPDEVPTIAGIDEAEHQHMVTYTIGFGLTGTLEETADPDTDGPGFWPNAMDTFDDERVDDLWHAAYNGRGEYLSAQDPAELREALNIAISDIAERTATAAAVAVNSARLTSESVVYLAQFNSNRWQGNLYAFPIVDLEVGTLSETPKWEANSLLTARDIGDDPRSITTFNGTKGVPLQWDTAALSTAMLNDLRTSPDGTTDSDTIAEARLDYLRGDRSNEGFGYQFRTRPSMLGDLINSGPVFVGEATLSWPDVAPFPADSGTRYSDFREGIAKTRTKTVYVGSNDGFLHAFDDDTGEEIFAYASNILSSSDTEKGFHYLTDPSYTHNWYVDLTPTLSDVYMNTHFGAGWHTILLGGLRGGGRGFFALDVTDPDQLTEDNADKIALWEFSSDTDDDLGYTYSRPTIALANNERWVAIFGNGYNDTGDGEAKLFIIDIEAGIDGWDAGDYIEITTQAGSPTDRNGLATPALADLDGNGTVDRVYAGDLQGKMWAFDLSDANPVKWASAYKTGSTPEPLFTTETNQPLTAKPVLARHPTLPLQSSPSNAPNLMVFFGTGQYLVESDKTDTSVQSFYGVHDRGDSALVRSANLIEQTFDPAYSGRVITRNYIDYSSDYGWWFDLPEGGERSVTSPIARRDTVFFNSFVSEANPCSVGGFGFKFTVDMETGGSPLEPVVDINKDGKIDDADKEDGDGVIAAIRQDGYLPEPVFIEDLVFTGEIAEKISKLPDVPTGRFSWQELIK